MAKIPSENLCAHVHDAVNDIRDLDRGLIDPFVSTIYKTDRTIQVCKEIAYLCKSVLASSKMDLQELHHLPVRRGQDGTVITNNRGLPEIVGRGFQLINTLVNRPQSIERDKALILMTKLAQLVLPLKVHEGARSCVSMIRNIETKIEPKFDFSNFRKFVRGILNRSRTIHKFDWRSHIRTLDSMCEETLSSTKKKPVIAFNEEGDSFYWDNESESNKLCSYDLLHILGSLEFRSLYLSDKETFLTLTLGRPVQQVTDDGHLLVYDPISGPIGRMGIRLQEADKVRTLWMPHQVFASLLNPMVELLETLVKESPYQTAYSDDSEAASEIRRTFFPDGKEASDDVISVDQSNYTDNFPYQLQRIVIEELVDMEVLPTATLSYLDLMVRGGYRPASLFKEVWTEDIHFANGTPMGGDGLWMLSTLTHEYLIRYLQDALCVHTPFRVQGDDATLQNLRLFKEYKETLENLGCTLNMSKTMISRRYVEFCGFISTPQQSVPMFRPHDRLNCSPRDLLSDRAIEAYGLDRIITWVVENRPHDLINLQVAGLIPVTEDDESYTVVITARSITDALKSRKKIIDCGESREQRARYYLNRESWPDFIEYDWSVKTSHQERSSFSEFSRRMKKLERLYRSLTSDSGIDYVSISQEMTNLCDEIQLIHSDFLRPELRIAKIRAKRDHPNRPGKSRLDDNTMSTVTEALKLIGHPPQERSR